MSRASVLAVVALGAPATLAALALPATAQDRYGPPAAYQDGAPQPVAVAPSAPPVALRGRVLSWPGKQDRAAAPAYALATPGRDYAASAAPNPTRAPRGYAPAAYAPVVYAPARYAPAPYAQRSYPGSTPARQPYVRPMATRQAYADPPRTYPAPHPDVPVGAVRAAVPNPYSPNAYAPGADAAGPGGWRPVFARTSQPPQDSPAAPPPALAGAPTAAALPSSIYTPASTREMTPAQRAFAAPPPLRTASAARRYGFDPTEGHAVRFYSVHRPFGLQPDAAPIPPQFFTATADLSQPAGPLPTDRTVTTTTGSGARVSRVAPDTSVN